MTLGEDIVIVFVHLGRHEARWLFKNITQTQKLFPKNRIILVSDNAKLLERCSEFNIEFMGYESSKLDFELLENTDWDLEFRSGFWLHTTRRFLALAYAHAKLKCPVLYIESDVVLSGQLDLNAFNQLREPISFGLVAPDIGVGALVYARYPENSALLASFVVEQFQSNSKTNDMEILGAFVRLNPDIVATLPTAPSPTSELFKPDTGIEFRHKVSAQSSHFGGIFDVATLGQFIGGTDPRNKFGLKKVYFVAENHCLDPSRVTFVYDESGWISIEESSTASKVDVFSLHIHSKDLRFFQKGPASRIIEKRISGFRGKTVSEFGLWGFIQALRSALRHLF